MKKFLVNTTFALAVLFVGAYYPLLAQNQFPSQIWHQGTIYGTDGQTYAGLVKYDLENNLVQLKTETISTFTASNVSHFEIYNQSNDGLRSFYSLPYSKNDIIEMPVLFEILTEGKGITLLCREYIDVNYQSTGSKRYNGPTNDGLKVVKKYRLAFDYFFFKDNEIQKYSLNKKDLLDFFPVFEEDINLFMKKNKLAHDKRGDLVRITAYYNELQN